MENQENSQLKALKKRIPFDLDVHKTNETYTNMLTTLLDDSLNIGLSIKYPFDDNKKTLPARYNNWQIRCCLELYKLAGNENIKSYKENGLEWTMFRDGLSTSLVEEIVPSVGIPKRSEEEKNDV